MNQTKRPNARAVPVAALAFLLLAFGTVARSAETPAAAKKAPAAAAASPFVVATVGPRKIDSVDIQRAAATMASDPLRKKDPAAWRRMLLDRCVERHRPFRIQSRASTLRVVFLLGRNNQLIGSDSRQLVPPPGFRRIAT